MTVPHLLGAGVPFVPFRVTVAYSNDARSLVARNGVAIGGAVAVVVHAHTLSSAFAAGIGNQQPAANDFTKMIGPPGIDVG